MWIRLIFGVLLVVVGGVWFALRISVLGGSPMTGDAVWAAVGLPMVVIGVVLLAVSASFAPRERVRAGTLHPRRGSALRAEGA